MSVWRVDDTTSDRTAYVAADDEAHAIRVYQDQQPNTYYVQQARAYDLDRYPVAVWQSDVACGRTSIGYAEWCAEQLTREVSS